MMRVDWTGTISLVMGRLLGNWKISAFEYQNLHCNFNSSSGFHRFVLHHRHGIFRVKINQT